MAAVICAGALVMIAALKLGPLKFLAVSAVVAVALIVILVRVARSALRMSSTTLDAAALADRKAQLKGRLLTIMTVAVARRRPALWDYLVEDTLAMRDEFAPSKIERRRLSPSVIAFLGACAIALLMLPHIPLRQPTATAANDNGPPSQIHADINNLVIRPADPALKPNARVFADANTLHALRQKLAQAENAQHNGGPLSKLMNRARNFGDRFQDKLTGRDAAPPVDMRLTDNKPGGNASTPGNPGASSNNGGSNNSNQSNQQANSGGNTAGNNNALPPLNSLSQKEADQLAQNSAGMPGYQAQPGDQNAPGNSPNMGQSSDQGEGGGSSHGSGTDPGNLFGKPMAPPLGSDSFKIAINAQPSDESSTPGAPAYIPPRVRVPLNSTQYPDEPLARTAIPAGDQLTIKRVFER
ncbi:MAG: hypothetical protein ACREQ4_15540 [Candidatus Binataceae bacterium]